MKNTAFYLSTCSTCKRILKEIGDRVDEFELQDIKNQPLTAEQVEELKGLSGSFEALFSRKSRQFRARGLHEKQLGESDYRQLLLDDYTFLKRPVFVLNGKIFIGNAQQTVDELKAALN